MHYTLNLPAHELEKFPAKGGILTKNGPFEPGDTVHLTCEKKQVSMQVLEVEKLNSRNCILWLKTPGVAMLKEAPEVLPAFSPHERETTDPNY